MLYATNCLYLLQIVTTMQESDSFNPSNLDFRLRKKYDKKVNSPNYLVGVTTKITKPVFRQMYAFMDSVGYHDEADFLREAIRRMLNPKAGEKGGK